MNHIGIATDDLSAEEYSELLALLQRIHRRRHPSPCDLHPHPPAPATTRSTPTPTPTASASASRAPAPARAGAAAGPDRPDPDRPDNGRSLLGWAAKHQLKDQVLKLGKSWKYPGKVIDWSPDQVHSVYHELTAKAHTQPWGG